MIVDCNVVSLVFQIHTTFQLETIKKLIVPDCARKTLQAIIRGKVDPESIIHSDSSRGYNGLVDLEYKKQCASWKE